MKPFLEWKKQYTGKIPTSWDSWLMMVHACLESLEDPRADHAQVQLQYEQTLLEKSTPLHEKASTLGMSVSVCESIADILELQERISEYEGLIEEWSVLSSRAESLGIALPVQKGGRSELAKMQEYLSTQLHEQKERVRLEEEWNDLCASYASHDLPLPKKPATLHDAVLKEARDVFVERLALFREVNDLMKRARSFGIEVKDRDVYLSNTVLRNFTHNQIEARAPIWARFDGYELEYASMGITRKFSHEERNALLDTKLAETDKEFRALQKLFNEKRELESMARGIGWPVVLDGWQNLGTAGLAAERPASAG